MAGNLDASAGGKARAKALSKAERSEIARKAAEKRWGSKIEKATHSGELIIGDKTISCAVLENGTRLITQESFLTALDRAPKAKGGTGSAGSTIPPFLAAKNLQMYATEELRSKWTAVRFRNKGNTISYGYDADILPDVCEIYLSARDDGNDLHSQQNAIRAAELIMRGLARVGITALVDEATGYQEVRARDELQQILDEFVQAELRPWMKRFPDEFFKEIYRINGWAYKPGQSKRTPYVGKLVNKYIYDQLAPGVKEELQRLNPKNDNGNRSHKHHQHLTEETGLTALDRQISNVTLLLRISPTKEKFEELFEEAFPPPQQRLPLVIET
ncbi:P63C domain-containing protein [Glutamicibacter sp. V16R2B1]|uniref:P63C domain-containing protein n=1 Tax=Glutamicibacter sp. V16R2B1 TaxID=2036207 RepID=UPI001484DE46|nr:P63C domain-containing protein [Glutamicibacter sp. V16R2B1]